MFCKVEDSNKNLYILTDKYKQPLLSTPFKNTCLIANGKKFLNNPELLLPTRKEIIRKAEIGKDEEKQKIIWESDFFVDTKIPYTLKNENSYENIETIVNKLDIDFNIYDIATINKDIVIKNRYQDDRPYTEKEIEHAYISLFYYDKDNKDVNDKMQEYNEDLILKKIDPPLNRVSEIITKMYDYYQKLLNKEEYNNCIISDWIACENSKRTRTRTQSTKIGTACTPDENNLPLTQTCTNCIVGNWSDCSNNKKTRTIIPATNGGTCTEVDTTQTCTNCVVGNWSDCSNNKKTRTIISATNGGTCTEVDTTQTCTNCVVGNWSECSNNKKTRTIIPATNGGTCTEVDTTQTCNDNMYIYIGIIILFIFAIAFVFYIFSPKHQ